MQALWFLTSKQIVNGIKRALRSPKRILGTLFFLVMMLMGPLSSIFSTKAASRKMPLAATQGLEQLNLQVTPNQVQAVLFCLFVTMFVLSAGMLTSARGTFKPADVDCLFPTPISPKLVLGVRIVRDSLFSIILPLFLYGLYFRRGTELNLMITKSLGADQVMQATRLGFIGYLLISAAFLAFGSGTGIRCSRPEPKMEKLKLMMNWGAFVLFLSWVGYVSLSQREGPSFDAFVSSMEVPVLQVLFFPATLATWMTSAPITGNWTMGIGALAGLVVLIGVGFKYALSQAGWLYEVNSLRATAVAEAMSTARQGNLYASAALRAKQGKMRTKSIRLVKNWRPEGAWALLWRDVVLFFRISGIIQFLAFSFAPIFILILQAFIRSQGTSERGTQAMGIVAVLMAHVMGTMFPLTNSQAGFTEYLRRLDVLRPLPFSATAGMYLEIVGKSVMGIVGIPLTFVAITVLDPSLWPRTVAGILFTVPSSVMLVALTALLVMLFPDVEDPTQRQFFGLVQMLGMLATLLIPVGLYLGLMLGLKIHPIPSAMVGGAVAGGTSIVLAMFAGRVAARFDPSE